MKGKLLSLLLPMALLTGCAAPVGAYRAPAGVTDLSRQLAADSSAPPAADPAADAAIGELGAALLRTVREPGENTLLSPLSISLALSMTANGAAGETLAEFEALLGADAEALNANATSLLADYENVGGSTVSNIANSLWLDDSLETNEQFLSRCVASYGADRSGHRADKAGGERLGGGEHQRHDPRDPVGRAGGGYHPAAGQRPLSEKHLGRRV